MNKFTLMRLTSLFLIVSLLVSNVAIADGKVENSGKIQGSMSTKLELETPLSSGENALLENDKTTVFTSTYRTSVIDATYLDKINKNQPYTTHYEFSNGRVSKEFIDYQDGTQLIVHYSYQEDGTIIKENEITRLGEGTNVSSDINTLGETTDTYIYDWRIREKINYFSVAYGSIDSKYNEGVITAAQRDNIRKMLTDEANAARADYIIMNEHSTYGSVKLGGSKAFPFKRNLEYNPDAPMSGLDVTVVQRALTLFEFLEFEDEDEETIYGIDTMEAVKKFQNDVMRINPNGIVGSDTYNAMLGVATKSKRNYDNTNKISMFKTRHDYVRDMTAMQLNAFNNWTTIGYGKSCNSQDNVICTEPPIPNSGRTGKVGYADIVNISSKQVWEVKPDNDKWNEFSTGAGVNQLTRYITGSLAGVPPVNNLSAGYAIQAYTVRWNFTQDLRVRAGNPALGTLRPNALNQTGMIYYKAVSKKNRTLDPLIVYELERKVDTESVTKVTQPNYGVLVQGAAITGAFIIGIHVGKAIIAVVAAPSTAGASLFLLLG